MSLQPLNASNPLGQYDALDSQVNLFTGGEVCTLVGTNLLSGDLAAKDSFDGYVGPTATTEFRPVVTYTLTSSSRPLFLADDGTTGYGTLFGSLVGATAGQIYNGATIGPSTAAGSGKITLWGSPGLYRISTSSVDTAVDGLVLTNAALTVGSALTYSTSGKLTPVGSTAATACGGPTVGHLSDFTDNGSLVTTPSYLVSALNSPSSDVGIQSLKPNQFNYVVVWFNGAVL